MQIKTTGSSGLEKKDRRYVADMDCGGCRHLPAGDAGHEDPGCALYEGEGTSGSVKVPGMVRAWKSCAAKKEVIG